MLYLTFEDALWTLAETGYQGYKAVRYGFELGPLEMLMEAGRQFYIDSSNPNLNFFQKVGRAAIVGGQTAITDVVSGVAGIGGALAGAIAGTAAGSLACNVPCAEAGMAGGIVVGKILGSALVTAELDRAWDNVNAWLFDNWVLGGSP